MGVRPSILHGYDRFQCRLYEIVVRSQTANAYVSCNTRNNNFDGKIQKIIKEDAAQVRVLGRQKRHKEHVLFMARQRHTAIQRVPAICVLSILLGCGGTNPPGGMFAEGNQTFEGRFAGATVDAVGTATVVVGLSVGAAQLRVTAVAGSPCATYVTSDHCSPDTQWLCSNFRFELGDLPTDRVAPICSQCTCAPKTHRQRTNALQEVNGATVPTRSGTVVATHRDATRGTSSITIVSDQTGSIATIVARPGSACAIAIENECEILPSWTCIDDSEVGVGWDCNACRCN